MQYSNFKDTLQNIASQIGNVEQEVEEHKYVTMTLHLCLHESCEVNLYCGHNPGFDYSKATTNNTF